MGLVEALNSRVCRTCRSCDPAHPGLELCKSVTALAGLGLSALLTVTERSDGVKRVVAGLLPGTGLERFVMGIPTVPGLASLAALVVLVLVAGFTYLHAALLRYLLLVLVLVSCVVVATELPRLADRSTGPPAPGQPGLTTASTVGVPTAATPGAAPSTTVPAAAGPSPSGDTADPAAATPSPVEGRVRIGLVPALVVLVGKMILLHRYAAMACSRVRRPRSELGRLLETQRRDLEAVVDRIRVGRGPQDLDEGRVVQLQGRWGDGKSFIVRRLEAALRPAPRPSHRPRPIRQRAPAVVHIDVWKYETEPDLHLAIFEEVLAAPCNLAALGWLTYPLTVLPSRYLSTLLVKLSASKGGVAVEVPVRLPRLAWPRPLERVVARQRRRRRQTVIILDEVDRSSPSVAQAAVTMVRRSLDLPGVAVVLVYVDELMRYKVFNPLVRPVLPDLGSTMEAVIYERAFDHQGALDPPPLGMQADDPSGVSRWWPAGPEVDVSGIPPAATHLHYEAPPGRPSEVQLSPWLQRGFAGASEPLRRQLQARMAEKFLGSSPVQVTELEANDIVDMIERFDTLRDLAVKVGGGAYDSDKRDAILSTLRQNSGAGVRVAPVRALEGELVKILLSIIDTLGRDFAGTPELLAGCVKVANRNALVGHPQSPHRRSEGT